MNFLKLWLFNSDIHLKNAKIANSYFYEYYRKKLSEGKALKCVQRRVINIIHGIMKNGTEYINPPSYDKPKDDKKTVK